MAASEASEVVHTTSVALEQARRLPQTRYMGSKYKLLPFIHSALAELEFKTALDGFSGTGSVAYLMKAMGKNVTANDHLHFCYHYANAIVANSTETLNSIQFDRLNRFNRRAKRFIARTFHGLYFPDSDNRFLDSLIANVHTLRSPTLRSLALSAAVRACIKRRPRGVFTYVGDRYLDGRKDLDLSLRAHFANSIEALNAAVFANGTMNAASCTDVTQVKGDFDLVYLDPPYVSPSSDNEYTRRYHFVEGLVRYWEGIEIQEHTQTKKFKALSTPFGSKRNVVGGFDAVFRRFADSTLVVSYSSTGIPARPEMEALLRRYKKHVHVLAKDHGYSFGTHAHKKKNEANRVQEYIFVGTD